MSCDSQVNKFTITKGMDNSFLFTVKADGTTLPIAIDPSDTFTAKLRKLQDSTVVLSKALEVVDAPSGKVELTITSAETALLTSLLGAKEDRYYAMPVYSLVIECSTVVNGDFLAKVRHVYVD